MIYRVFFSLGKFFLLKPQFHSSLCKETTHCTNAHTAQMAAQTTHTTHLCTHMFHVPCYPLRCTFADPAAAPAPGPRPPAPPSPTAVPVPLSAPLVDFSRELLLAAARQADAHVPPSLLPAGAIAPGVCVPPLSQAVATASLCIPMCHTALTMFTDGLGRGGRGLTFWPASKSLCCGSSIFATETVVDDPPGKHQPAGP